MSFLSGRHCSSTGVGRSGVPLPPDIVSVQQLLKPYGYRTAQIGKLNFDPHAKRDHRNPTGTYGFDRFVLSDEPGCYDDAYIKWVQAVAPDQLPGVRAALPPAAKHYGHPAYSTQQRDGVQGYSFGADESLTHSSFVAAETCRFLADAAGLRRRAGALIRPGPVGPPPAGRRVGLGQGRRPRRGVRLAGDGLGPRRADELRQDARVDVRLRPGR